MFTEMRHPTIRMRVNHHMDKGREMELRPLNHASHKAGPTSGRFKKIYIYI